jgi:hypothetical protein
MTNTCALSVPGVGLASALDRVAQDCLPQAQPLHPAWLDGGLDHGACPEVCALLS